MTKKDATDNDTEMNTVDYVSRLKEKTNGYSNTAKRSNEKKNSERQKGNFNRNVRNVIYEIEN